ncbi:PREDICTED: uncharacterized protein LOC108565576 isoform X2 [Nicrophorus vespilloides]|uniref:Uncharacterized protein LOC108565576 isoform X2 n=1 Tax=Nicrophorus vespilloides TaxID=110193 RepID=A0ABM1N1A3_NICVS|nr:PREDICTED: uncharacterized protein LOC108565576 isoform X2 [Nicrophorus vespilloides]
MKAYLVLFSIGLLFGTANALKCYQCRGANSDCEKLKDVTEVNCESLMFGTSGYPDNFKPPFQSPMLNGKTPLCVHFAYDIQTYRGCMMTEKTELATQCNKLKSDFQNVNEPYTCDYCELDNCNGNSRITGHPFALLMASLLFIKGVLLH